jgi:hypothetical protein
MSLSRLSLGLVAVALAAAAPTVAAAQAATGTLIVVIRGAINDPSNAGATEDPADARTPVLPVVYEE